MEPLPNKPPGFVHVDLDGIWTLAGVYGYPEADTFEKDVVFDVAAGRLLELFWEMGIYATFFIVGRDLESQAKRRIVKQLADAGHELASHSYSHRLDLELLEDAELRREVVRASGALESLTGNRPMGFRAPGYCAGPRTLNACSLEGIRYDGSCLPTRWGGVLRGLANGLRGRVQREEGIESDGIPGAELQYGGVSMNGNAFAPESWTGDGGQKIVRFPLAVSPLLRVPLHASLGMMMGAEVVSRGLRHLARKGEPITWLLHGLDLIGQDELVGKVPWALLRQRGFRAKSAEKMGFLKKVLRQLRDITELQTTEDWIRKRG